MPKGPLVLRGSLITFSRRCGKASCRCATGEPHTSPAVSYSQAGRTKMIPLQETDVAEVRAALARYHKPRRALERQADAGLRELTRRIEARRASRRRR